jgi:hypothetical protein
MGIAVIVTLSTITAILAGSAAEAATIRIELDFDQPYVTQREDGSVSVSASGCVTFNDPGLPLLPACPATVLLPPGESVTAVRVLTEGEHILDGVYMVSPAQQPQPLNLPGPFPPTEPDAAVYSSDDLYPSAAARLVTEQRGWGHGLAIMRAHPVAYRPATGELVWYERVVVEVDTALGEGADQRSIPRLRRSQRVLDRLAGMVMNPEDLSLYEESEPAPLPWSQLQSDYYPYVIITDRRLKPAFESVAAMQSSRGLRTYIASTEEIYSGYGGNEGNDDPAARVRQFIIDAYENWGTDYVLLGGDETVIPHRLLTVMLDDVPWRPTADCYFEGLDGNWNDDGDDYYGEVGEEDLFGEVAVGRAVANTVTEIRNWSHKNEMYTERPVVDQVQKVLFIGERLDNVITWGGDLMDEIKDGSCNCGYSTVGYPLEYDTATLYERDGAWDNYDLIDLMNEGFPTSHHLGHSYWLLVMKIMRVDLDYLTNDGVSSSYMLNYSQGCSAGAFQSSEECICESFLINEHGSAALLCNSSSGWYNPGELCGASQYYEREFVDARYGEGIVTVGWMNVDSKADLVWMLNEYNRYVHYELNLFGDPAMPQWGSVEGHLAMEHAGKYVIGSEIYKVTVTDGEVPVPGATVTMYSSDFTVWTSAVTNDSGLAQLHPGDCDFKTLYLKAVKPDYLMATDELRVRRR